MNINEPEAKKRLGFLFGLYKLYSSTNGFYVAFGVFLTAVGLAAILGLGTIAYHIGVFLLKAMGF